MLIIPYMTEKKDHLKIQMDRSENCPVFSSIIDKLIKTIQHELESKFTNKQPETKQKQ